MQDEILLWCISSPDESNIVGFRKRRVRCRSPGSSWGPRVWGNGIPIKFAWVLEPRSEFRVTPGDTCALASSASNNRTSQNPNFHQGWKVHEEKIISGRYMHFLYSPIDEFHKPFTVRNEKMHNFSDETLWKMTRREFHQCTISWTVDTGLVE